jgi:hypothetical protein
LAYGNHEEADTRVWLHASVSSADQVIIYSPDTDVFVIGLSIVLSLNKTVYVQLKDSPYDCTFLCMNKLIRKQNHNRCKCIIAVNNSSQQKYPVTECHSLLGQLICSCKEKYNHMVNPSEALARKHFLMFFEKTLLLLLVMENFLISMVIVDLCHFID